MKTRFTTIDLMAVLHDIRKCVGLRVNNVYDIDSKTYLIKLMKPNSKSVLLIESGIRMYLTEFDYPKNIAPSGFSMKLRKHIRQKRLESAQQLGVDRIVDLQFGSGEFACHVIVELYDRGNVILTDHEHVILNVLRPRTDKENADVRFRVREKYPLNLAKQPEGGVLTREEFEHILQAALPGDNLRKTLTPKFVFGPALLEHCMAETGFSLNQQISKLNFAADSTKLYDSLLLAYKIFASIQNSEEFCSGVITLKKEKRPLDKEIIETYVDFQPMLFAQAAKTDHRVFDTFNKAVDEFFSKIESQKIDAKSIQQEKNVVKKLENVRRDHESRLKNLQEAQDVDKKRAQLIESNKELVDHAILVINSALAEQMSWKEIDDVVQEAKERGDKVALCIESLQLGTNHACLKLIDPYHTLDDEGDDFDSKNEPQKTPSNSKQHFMLIDIDLGMSAFQNARKFYTHKKQSAFKEQKTIQASEKALKSAEQKTQEMLKQVQTNRQINKSRKPFWFEKFFWFFSTDGLLVVGGRDAQQNEILVKRHLKPGDVYVHADIRGASSVVVKGQRSFDGTTWLDLPPRSLLEAGTMAICHSAAWDAKVVTSAWWVNADQVTKTAPTGEYLTTGSFMIRGKKNFLPPCQLIMGFGLMFKLDEESAAKRAQAKLQTASDLQALDGQALEGTTSVGDSMDPQEFEDIEINLEEEDEKVDEKEAEENDFPDIAVDLRHLNVEADNSVNEEFSVINIGPRFVSVPKSKKNDVKNVDISSKLADQAAKNLSNQTKRRQKTKLKKIKEKYKDQDEEERELRIRLLGSSKHAKNQPDQQKPLENLDQKEITAQSDKKVEDQISVSQSNDEKKETDEQKFICEMVSNVVDAENQVKNEVKGQVEPDDDEILDEVDPDDPAEDGAKSDQPQPLVDFCSLLTGNPSSDDPDEILMFALPVCAPYSVMVNWKFKVKLTPGTGKKGRATKTALEVFLRDRRIFQREKDLLKALNDQDLSRNLPGKVKVSAPQLQKVKKKH